MIKKQFIFLLLTPFLLLSFINYGQGVTSYAIPAQGVPLDLISLKQNQIHLITSNGVYQFSGDSLRQIQSYDSLGLKFSSQNYLSKDADFFYNKQSGGYSKIDLFQTKNTLAKITRDFKEGLVLYGKKNIWIAEQDIYRNTESYWEIVHEVKGVHNRYWDGKVLGDDIWLSHYGHGVFLIMNEDSVINIKKSAGLYDDFASSISVIGDQIYVGHNGAVSIIDRATYRVQTKSMENEIGSSPIIEIEPLSNGDIAYLTPRHIFCESEKKIKQLSVNMDADEEWLAIHCDDDGQLWLLSNKSLYRQDNNAFEQFDFPDAEVHKSFLYQIRKNTYFSTDNQVLAFVPENHEWEIHQRKIPPVFITTDSLGNTLLGFEDRSVIKLDKTDARLLAEYSLPENEEINNLVELGDTYYVCTNENLYINNKEGILALLNTTRASFHNIKRVGSKIYAFAAEGVFEISGDSLEVIIPASSYGLMPRSKNQIIEEEKVILAGGSQLIIIDTRDNSFEGLDMGNIAISDILQDQHHIYIISKKSLLTLDRNKVLQGEAAIQASLPLPHPIMEAALYEFGDDQLWIKGVNRLLKVDKSALNIKQMPVLSLDKIIANNGQVIEVDSTRNFYFQKRDLPLRFSFYNNNFWTNDQRYVYHLAGPENNVSEWQSSSNYLFDTQKAGTYLLNVKMRDEVFGEDIYSDTIHIEVLDESYLSRKTILIIPLFLLFSLILGYFATKS